MAVINYIIWSNLILELRNKNLDFKFFNLDCMYLGIKTPCIQNLEFISANFLNIMPYLGFSILFAAYATATILKN